MNLLEKSLCEYLDSEESMDQQDCAKFRNMLKMFCYLLCQFLEAVESKLYQNSNKHIIGKGKKLVQNESSVWDEERIQGITALNTICQLKLHKLWDPPIIEEDFVNLIMNCCFKLLENQNTVRCKSTKNAIFNLLGISLKKYKNSLSCSLKIIQFVQHFDYLVSPLAQAVELFVNEYGINNIVNEIIREISQMDIQDLIRDNTGTKSVSQFLVEITEKIPSVVLHSSSLLLHFLDEEPYVMRCGVLSMFGEIIIKVFSNTELENKAKDLRDQMLAKLEEHIHDVNAFVRSKALQIWQNLCKQKAIPLDHQHPLLVLIISRLMDKSSFVRKYAIQFINTIIQVNPFGGVLGIEELQATLKKEEEYLEELLSEEQDEDENEKIIEWEIIKKHFTSMLNDEIEEDITQDTIYQILSKSQESLNDQNLKEFFQYTIEQLSDFEAIIEDNEEKIDQDNLYMTKALFFIEKCYINYLEIKQKDNSVNYEDKTPAENKIKKQQNLVYYFRNMLQFSQEIEKALPIICQLLHSTYTSSDILESIRFFVTAYQFGIKDAVFGIKSMLSHIWSKEDVIKDAVVSAYKELYLANTSSNRKESVLSIVKNIILLIQGSTFAEEICLEKLIGEFMKSEDFNNNIIEMLWDIYSMKIPNSTLEESHSALKLLRMAATFQTDIVEKNIELLLSVAFNSENMPDFVFICDVCKMLLQLANSNKDNSNKSYYFPNEDVMFKKLSDVLVKGVIKLNDHFWIPMAEQAINVIYKLAHRPDKLCAKIMEEFSHLVSDSQSPFSEDTSRFPLGILQRIISFSGHVALQHLLYIETYVIPELKKQIQQNNTQKGKRKSDTSNISLRKRSSIYKDDNMNSSIPDEDVGMIELVDETEIEYFRKTFEANIFSEENLFGIIYPLVIEICKTPNKYLDNHLQATCAITLGKFMMISSSFCDSNLQLLVTLMEKSTNPVVRGNTVIAFGDLAVRFPNIIEPWTTHIYNRLHDSSTDVKKKALIILSHLILHDIIKVKQQISDVALCLVDKEDCIVQLTKVFFQELSKKGNAIYNILSDIISHLSDPEVGTTQEFFQDVTKYLFQFIEKEKHVEALVEKLCYRFRTTRNEVQWRNLAFCLSLLTYNERSLLKLQENLGCLGEKLADDIVYEYMTSIYNGARKIPNLKGKAKTIIEELEQQIEIMHKNDGQEAAVYNEDSVAKSLSFKTPAKTPGSRIQNKIKTCGKSTRKSSRKKKVHKPVLSFSSDESD
ncbi:condensin complex subunit 1-like isoform X2 [Centruroides vittatus]